MSKSINELCAAAFETAKSKGWHEDIDLEAAITAKMEKNKGRSYKHGNKQY